MVKRNTPLKDPHAPKRAKTPYILFSVEERVRVLDGSPKLSFVSVSKEVGRRWALLSDQDRQPYIEQSKEDRDRYIKACEAYEKGSFETPERKRKRRKKDPHAPKRGKSSFICFSAATRGMLVKATPTMSTVDVARQLGVRWRAMDATERRPFEEESRKDRQRYEEGMRVYQSTETPSSPRQGSSSE